MILIGEEGCQKLAARMVKWWQSGYTDAAQGKPHDPPIWPGNGAGDAYAMGYEAGQRDRACIAQPGPFTACPQMPEDGVTAPPR